MLVVVTGAGASFDCASAGVADLKPPLVKDLFDPGRSSFNNSMTLYPLVQIIAPNIRRATANSQNGISLENFLRQHLKESSNERFRLMFTQVQLYLQHIIWDTGAGYTTHPDHYDSLVQKLLQVDSPVVVTTNYDTILDNRLAETRSLNKIADYVDDEDWSLIKLHGSVNWARRLAVSMNLTNPVANHSDYISRVRGLGPDPKLDEEILLMSTTDLARTRWSSEAMYYPALSVPLGIEDTINCPPEHITFLRSRLDKAETIDLLFLGYSGNDNEVFDLIGETKAKLGCLNIVVGNDVNVGHKLLRRIAPMFNLNSSLNSELVHSGGFSDWVLKGKMDQFFTDVDKSIV
jgi:SIR2-like protein